MIISGLICALIVIIYIILAYEQALIIWASARVILRPQENMNAKQCELAKGPTRGLVLILVPNPCKSSPLLVSNPPAGGEMRVPQRQ